MLSVIIPTFERRALLEKCLTSVFLQRGAGEFEMIVVDDGSTDGTADYLRGREKAGELRVVHHKQNRGPAAARNSGVAIARGEILAFIDDDCAAAPDWLAELARPFEAPEILAAFGAIIYKEENASVEYDECIIDNPEARKSMGGNFAIRREIFERLNGFDESLYTFEDVDLSLRVWSAGRVASASLARVYHAEFRWTPETLDRWVARARVWPTLLKRHDFSIDQNYRLKRYWIFLEPRDWLAIGKYLLRAPLNLLRLRRQSGARAQFELRWLKTLVRRRLSVWRGGWQARTLVI